MSKAIIPVGTRFAKLVVIGAGPPRIKIDKRGNYMQPTSILRCDCGSTIEALNGRLKEGIKISCGCFNLRGTHRMTDTPTWRSWRSMIDRCQNPNNPKYHLWGGRGITVCARWLESFENFLADMGIRPMGCTISRQEEDGHYEPGNCKWETVTDQNRKKRNNLIVSVRGVIGPLSQVAEHFGKDRVLVGGRLRNGWPIEKAFFFPTRHQRIRNTTTVAVKGGGSIAETS